jgi:hypothetical protein
MSRKILKLGLAVALAVLAIAATVIVPFLHHTTVLEWRFVFQPHITALQSGGQTAIRISGLCGHSALSVKDISVQRSGTSQVVTVRVFFAASMRFVLVKKKFLYGSEVRDDGCKIPIQLITPEPRQILMVAGLFWPS